MKSEWRIGEDTDYFRVYLTREQRKKWEQAAQAKGFTRRTKKGQRANLSGFVETTINLLLNGTEEEEKPSPEHVEHLRAQLRSREAEIERLRDENAAVKRREVGVSEVRILERLTTDKDTHFDVLVQELIDTEAQAAYETLQQLILKGAVTYGGKRNTFRLKPQQPRGKGAWKKKR